MDSRSHGGVTKSPSRILAAHDAQAYRSLFEQAQPTRFVRIDRFLCADFESRATAAFPSFESAARLGLRRQDLHEKHKVQISDPKRFPEAHQQLFLTLSSPQFCDFLEQLSGIEGLVPDTKLLGAGLHLMRRGGELDPHLDFNMDPETGLYRRLNLILYLHEQWLDSWGGALEFWDPASDGIEHAIAPLPNRCVIFEPGPKSVHGVERVRSPIGTTRNSFALYYYTRQAPTDGDGSFHDVRFQARPEARVKRWLLVPLKRCLLDLRHGVVRRLQKG